MAMGWGMNRGIGVGPDNRFSYIVPASETKEGKKRLTEYYEALGRFVDMFARVETAITLTLWHYAGTNPYVGKIIFAGSKIDGYSIYIKQLAEAKKATKEAQDDLKDVLQQLGIINGVRNKVLHYGAESVAEGNAIVSDALKAKGEPERFPISPVLLDQMTGDLTKIVAHLDEIHLKRRTRHTILGSPTLGAWRYKHPAQTKKQSKKAEGQQSQKRAPKPPRPPRPSRASRRKAALDRKI
jgi:hypothetical protein